MWYWDADAKGWAGSSLFHIAQVGAFSVSVKTDGSFAALLQVLQVRLLRQGGGGGGRGRGRVRVRVRGVAAQRGGGQAAGPGARRPAAGEGRYASKYFCGPLWQCLQLDTLPVSELWGECYLMIWQVSVQSQHTILCSYFFLYTCE